MSSQVRSSLFVVPIFLGIVLGVTLNSGQAQTLSTIQPAPVSTKDYFLVEVGPHSRVWRNSSGQSVTEIATGMNYWDGQHWTPSDPSFAPEQNGSGFVASKIQDPTQLASNLNVKGAVNVTTPDGVALSSTPIAIGLYDTASGKSTIIASLTNSVGVLVNPQEVVY